MKNLIVFYDDDLNLRTELQDIPAPSSLKPHEVLIKVEVAGSNPKDWKHPLPNYFNIKINQGDDCAGTVAEIGSAVTTVRVGDKVAGFHEMDTPNGTYAEYAVCPEQTVFRLPQSMSYEEAATMPLAIFTAAVGLYRNLDIPAPWDRSDEKAASTGKVAFVVNAGSSTVGAFAIKLAKLNPRIGPIIATAGASGDYVRSLGVDTVVDYRSSDVAEEIRKAANGAPIRYVFDAANTLASTKYLTAVMEKGAHYTCTTPYFANKIFNQDGAMEEVLKAAGVHYEMIWCGDVHETKKAGGILFGSVMSRAIEQALVDGNLSGQPYEVVKNGLDGVLEVLQELKDRNLKKSGNTKYVTRINDTPSLKE